MKKITFLAVIAVCITVVSMIGCGSDSVTDSDLVIGDTTSPTFQFMRDSVGETSFDITGLGMELTFELLGQQFPSAAPSKLAYNKAAEDTVILVSSQYSYDTTSGWHVFTFRAIFIETVEFDTTTVEGIDSIQTLVNNVPVPNPDSTVNGLIIRTQYAFENNKLGSGVGHQSYGISAVPGFETLATVTVNGNTNDTLDFRFGENADTCDLDMNNSLTISNVVFQIDVSDECPTSGTIVANQNIVLNCVGGQGSLLDSLNIDGSWTATLTFNGQTTTISFTDGTTTWSYTEPCLDTASVANPGLSGLSGFTIKQ